VGSSSLPPHIQQSDINAIPDTPGCYIFYGENNATLYIGKSLSMRSRVMSHFHSALTDRKEMKLSQQVHHIDFIETSGELGALILESKLIKERMPSMNIKLRRSTDLCAWQLKEDHTGLQKPVLITHKHLQPGLQDDLYGLFYNKKEARGYLAAVAKKYQLCEALLGLEKVDEGSLASPTKSNVARALVLAKCLLRCTICSYKLPYGFTKFRPGHLMVRLLLKTASV
jgi:DNA polymerase-3 subunit epsilon